LLHQSGLGKLTSPPSNAEPPQNRQHAVCAWSRRKNNEAAKRSRDIRRANERRVALQAALLERENARLRCAVGLLTDDTLRLHYALMCSRAFHYAGAHRPHHSASYPQPDSGK